MLQQSKKTAAANRRAPKADRTSAPACPPQPEPVVDLAEVVFYGASRFEQPEIGLLFRRDDEMYRLVAIAKSERNYLRRFSQVWAFTALCERLPNRIH